MNGRSAAVYSLSARRSLKAHLATRSGAAIKCSPPTPVWNRRKPLPVGLLLVVTLIGAWTSVGLIVWGLLRAVAELRRFVG